MTKPEIKYYYRGMTESLRYNWIEGYSEGENDIVSYPWMGKRQCQADAKARGCKAVFIREVAE